MSSELSALMEAAPDWAALLAQQGDAADFLAAPPLPSGTPVPATLVRVATEDGLLFAQEREPGTRLPRHCPELHVNRDSSFCLGRRTYDASAADAAAGFWQDLGEYLVNQHHAARRSRWPTGRWLSHGSDAADRQAEAERIAARIGLAEDYEACLEYAGGWIADVVRAAGGAAGGEAACPRGCVDRRNRPTAWRRCRHRSAIARLIGAERARRAAEKEYFDMLRRHGIRCCGRIAACPLAEEKVAA